MVMTGVHIPDDASRFSCLVQRQSDAQLRHQLVLLQQRCAVLKKQGAHDSPSGTCCNSAACHVLTCVLQPCSA